MDLRPNKDAPGFETKAIIHFANPIFIEACQEILMLFPPEALKYLQRSPGILITVAAAVSSLKIIRAVVHLRISLSFQPVYNGYAVVESHGILFSTSLEWMRSYSATYVTFLTKPLP